MPPLTRWATAAPAVALALGLTVVLGACGSDSDPRTDLSAERALKECRAQWEEVGETVIGMEQDTHPSALSERWNTVIATVEYYKTVDTAKDCQAQIETQLKTVSSLRQFSEKLRPYDMTYQLSQARAAIDIYLHEPLPEPARNENGKLVKPPTKAAVTAAMQVLTAEAEQANAELAPGWEQTKSVDLTDVPTLTKTMQDLDFLAQDSPSWRRCEEALQVLVAAIRAQEGLVGAPAGGPTDASSPTG